MRHLSKLILFYNLDQNLENYYYSMAYTLLKYYNFIMKKAMLYINA